MDRNLPKWIKCSRWEKDDTRAIYYFDYKKNTVSYYYSYRSILIARKGGGWGDYGNVGGPQRIAISLRLIAIFSSDTLVVVCYPVR